MAKSKIEGITYAELEKSIKQKQFAPVYFFLGEEDFLVTEGIHAITEHAVDEATKSFNLDILYGSDVDARQILAIASSYPMMADRRVVIVREFEKVTSKELLVPYFEKPAQTTCLALVASKADFRIKAFDALKKNAVVVKCDTLWDNELPDWIQSRIKKLGKSIRLEACQLIHARTGNSLRVVQSELDKLFIFLGDKKEITAEDVEGVVGMSKQYNIFELQKSLGSLQIARSMEIMERMLDSGESPIGMIVMLTRYFQKIRLYHEFASQRLNEFAFAGKLGVSPSFIKDYAEAARNYSYQEIEYCFYHLLEADEGLKFSADVKVTMTMLLYKMLKKVKNLEYETV